MTTGTRGATETQRLSAGGLKPLADLVDHLDLTSHFAGDAVLNGADPVIRSPHHLGEASAMGHLLIGIAGARHLACAHGSEDRYRSRHHTRTALSTFYTLCSTARPAHECWR